MDGSRTSVSAVDLEVIRASLSGIVQEMQNSLFRTGFSTIIRESQDASCAILDADARVVAQHVVLPLHLGAFPACVAAVLRGFGDDIEEGDAFLINHPYEGGSPHAPDMAVISPIFHDGAHVGFCASIAHKGDIGGPVPGSCSGQARETYNEGLHLPAVRYQRGFRPYGDVERIIAANSRTSDLVLGDIRGQLGSDRLGERRVAALMDKYGAAKCLAAFGALIDLSERRIRAGIAEWGDGSFEATRYVDDDGIDLEVPVKIHVRVEKTGDRILFDFTASADQTRGPSNIRPPLLRAACAYALISLIEPGVFISSGILNAIDIRTRPGSVVDPVHPAPVNTYNPTVHAVVDAIFAALGHLARDRSRADGCAARSIIIGGRNRSGDSYVQYEILGGGAGARPTRDGASGTTVNQSNAKIASVEIVESEFPTRLLRFELIRDSGGPGRFRGGLGIRRKYLNLADARFSIRSAKHRIPAGGEHGGLAGRTGDIRINPDAPDGGVRLPTRYADYPLKADDVFELETPGGGGWGDAGLREPDEVLADVRDGYVSPEVAAETYKVVILREGSGWTLDAAATQALRNEAA